MSEKPLFPAMEKSTREIWEAGRRAGAIEACRELAASFRMCAGEIAELSPHRVNAEQTYEHCARLADDFAARYVRKEGV